MENFSSIPAGGWVSYSSGGYKAAALELDQEIVLTDIFRFRTQQVPDGKTAMRLRQDGAWLDLEVDCCEPDPALIQAGNQTDGMPVWSGDLLEIFFGAIEPVPWQLQLAVGAGGGRFDSGGTYSQWEAQTSLLASGWRARIRIPLSLLRLQNLGCGFNLCRQSLVRNEFSCWARLDIAFHEIENYGELFFCDYPTAFFAKTGKKVFPPFNRQDFERGVAALAVPSEQVVHGPFLSNPAAEAMTITWGTAGMAAALLEYRREGTKKWLELPVERSNGILRRNSKLHVAHLNGLQPDTRYQYRLVNFSALLKKRVEFPAGQPLSFCTLSQQPAGFSFAACSDIHSNGLVLKKLLELPEVQQTAFWVNLGDMLSWMSGPDAFFSGFLDVESGMYAREKPLVFVRGNHEQVGIFAADYLRVMPHPSGKTFYAFQHGAVFFLVLDAGDDKADEPGGIRYNSLMQEEEREWLLQIAQSESYQKAAFRIAFMHMPPYNDEYGSRAALRVLSAIPEAVSLDLLLCGHVHQYFRMPARSGQCRCFGQTAKASMKNTPVLPYTVVGNDTSTLVLVQVARDQLQVQVLDCKGSQRDEFQIRASGQTT